jgi:hypothetical protein
VKYEKGFYIPEDDILHSYRRANLKSYKQNAIQVILMSEFLLAKLKSADKAHATG